MTPGAYVVVHGNIKEYDGRLTISAYDMRPVEDFNQVTHHYLEAIYVHAKRVKIQVSSGAAPARRDSMAGFHPTTHGQSAAGGADGADGMTSLQKRVLDYYTENGTKATRNNTDSVAFFGLDLGQVKAAVEFARARATSTRRSTRTTTSTRAVSAEFPFFLRPCARE